MATTTKVKLNKKKCKTGMDTLEFIIALEGMEELSFDEETLPNDIGKSIVTMKCTNGKISGTVNAVHCIRDTNAEPFSLTDSIKMEIVRNKVFDFIRDYLKRNLGSKYKDKQIESSRVTSLEVNVTRCLVGKATPSNMIHLFTMVFGKARIWTDRKSGSKCEIDKDTFEHDKKHEYRIKAYNKGKQLDIDKALFRIEIVFKDRKLNAMFGNDKRTLDNILSVKSLDIMCRTYKEVFEEIVKQHIKPYLDNCVTTLYESLTWSDSGKEISDTVMRYKDIIVDIECLRRALHKWYENRIKRDPTVKDRTDEMIYKYRKKELGLPEDVLKNLKTFHMAAG